MYKIKLLILLLISITNFSCTTNDNKKFNHKYSLAYISGEYDGLTLKNYLLTNLKNLDIYDKNSKYEIQSSIEHSSNLFITNIDNTSDREKIITKLAFKIIDKEKKCLILVDQISISQFYIYASTDKFLSNKRALKKIKRDNTEIAVKQFIKELKKNITECDV